MTEKIFDAHIHLNLKSDSPFKDLIALMDDNRIEKAMLILNNSPERAAFMKELPLYKVNRKRFRIASGLNIHDEDSIRATRYLMEQGIVTSVKIHPHMFCLSKDEIPEVIEVLSHYPVTVIVDALYYDKEIEFHNGVEYAVAIGGAFPDRKVVVAHAGSLDFLKCMMATRYMPNVFYDYSFTQSFFNRTSLRLDMVDFLSRTTDKIMWGSDYPSFSIARAYSDFNSIAEESGITLVQMENVLYNNALRVYGE